MRRRSATKMKTERKPEWLVNVRHWLRSDPDATAQSIRSMLLEFGTEVPLRTVSHHLKTLRPKRLARAPERRGRQRDAATRNRAFAVRRLKALRVQQGVAEGMAALAGLTFARESEERRAFKALDQAREGRDLPNAINFLADDAADAENRKLGDELTRSVERVQIASRRAGNLIDGPEHAVDRSSPCLLAHQEIKGAHRHCAACGRDWAEGALGFTPLHVPVTTENERTGERTRLGYRYVVKRADAFEWTEAPRRRDAFVWACIECWHAAASALPSSLDRDVLLENLTPTPQAWLASANSDGLLQRLYRREPGLWPWLLGSNEEVQGRRIITIAIKFDPLRSGRVEVRGGAAAQIGFARHAEVRHLFSSLFHLQHCVRKLVEHQLARRKKARSAASLSSWALPSLAVRGFDVLVEIDEVKART
jgi:DNA-binding transcriptional ArsR family regulator